MKNDHVNPAFMGALESMFGSPSKVAADRRENERLVELAEAQREVFNEWDDSMMHDVVGCKRLQKPIQDLLVTLSQIDATKDSFGLNAERTVQFLIPQLKKLRQACIEEWNDQ